jgi:hypothetical protein
MTSDSAVKSDSPGARGNDELNYGVALRRPNETA